MIPRRGFPWISPASAALLPLLLACSSQTLDAGSDLPHGLLPVDERNPILISNDGTGNWQGLYAVLFAKTGGPKLTGIAVNTSRYATDLDANLTAWRALVGAARGSGFRDVPEPTPSNGAPLARPESGEIDATTANDSEGARLILELSRRESSPYRPLVIVAGGRLTDVADAYLLDPTVTERVVVVAALGSLSAQGGVMNAPNGELDPWADWIVAERFRYVQVSAFYDTTADLPATALTELPKNPLTELVRAEQPKVTSTPTQADQVGVLAVGLPSFVTAVARVARDPARAFDTKSGPELIPNPTGNVWLVSGIDATLAGAHFRELLRDPKTYGE